MNCEALRIHCDCRDVPDAKLTLDTAYHAKLEIACCLRVVRDIMRARG